MEIVSLRQYIYRLNSEQFIEKTIDTNHDNTNFKLLKNISDVANYWSYLLKRHGLSLYLLKLILKVSFKGKLYYALTCEGQIVSDGEVTFGSCNHYSIGGKDCVIGPVFTDGNYRGRGFATIALANCIHRLINDYHPENLYIDTKEDNIAMQKVIKKIGFGDEVDSYIRDGAL